MSLDDPRYFSSRKIQEALQQEVASPGFDRLFRALKDSSIRLILIRYHTLKNAQNRRGWKAPPIADRRDILVPLFLLCLIAS